jgi:hypothetical protein
MKQILQLVFLLLSYTTFSQQYVNGNLSTGTVSNSGVTAPAGYTWSELQSNVGEPSITNSRDGIPIDYGQNNKNLFADDFVIPVGQTWNINNFEFFVIKDLSSTLPITELGIEIWNADPSLSSSVKLHGDITLNSFDASNSGDALMYHIRNTSSSLGNFAGTANSSNKIWKIRGNFSLSLSSGTYWIVFQPRFNISSSLPVMVPLNRYPGSRGYATNSNSRFYQNAPGEILWSSIFDGGYPSSSPDIPQDYPFKINYTLTLNNSEVTNSFFKLYPNPTKDQFTIQTDAAQSVLPQTAVLYDIRGLKVFETKINAIENNSFTIDISSLNKGIYFVKLLDSDKVIYTNKIIKE